MLRYCSLFTLCLFTVVSSVATLAADEPAGFQVWLQQYMQTLQAEKKLDKAFLRQIFAGIQYDTQVIKRLNNQPEFHTTFSRYLRTRLNENRVNRAKQAYYQHQKPLAAVQQIYGVDAAIIVALWSLETNLGSYTGNHYLIQALATLAYDSRRKAFFRKELQHAVQLMYDNNIKRRQFKGSWAGAMGQPQFMPSTYVNYAVDGNGNGVIDLWHELEDVFHSAAHYLQKMHWQRQQSWGEQVLLGDRFDYSKSGIDWSLPVEQWVQMGVTGLDGSALASDKQLKAAVLLPDGREGKAFMVFDNFRAILLWNRSNYYALSVGLLADLIRDRLDLEDLPISDSERKLNTLLIKQVQDKLNQLGLQAGKVDGIIGFNTKRAIRQYQQQNNLIADGYLDARLAKQIVRQ